MRRTARGQSALEFVTLFVAATMGLALMFTYVRSALSHRMKSGADGIGQGMLFP